MHSRSNNVERDPHNNLHYTDWESLNSAECIDHLQHGVQVRSSKSRQKMKKVNIDNMELIDDDFANDRVQYADTRISKWTLSISKSPKALYKALRSVGLSPYYIHRVAIENESFGDLQIDTEDELLSIGGHGEWRTMWHDEIKCLNGYDSPQLTHIAKECVMTQSTFQNMKTLVI